MVDNQVQNQENTLKLCKNKKCCGKYLFFAKKEGEKVLLPLKRVAVKSRIHGATAVTNVELTYVNPSAECPLECTYVFPLEKNTVLANFEAIIDQTVVATKIFEKEKVKEKYDDAITSGNAAVLAERSDKKEETMTIKLGNLLPGQQATLKSQIISKLEIVGGSYAYILPVAFYPDYRRHGARSNNDFVYEFSYEVEIVAEGSHISNLSLPEHAEITDKDETNRRIKVKSQRVSRTIELYYRTADMLMPQLLYAVSPETGEVACTASLVPTFDAVAPQDLFEVVKNEKPESVKLGSGSEFHFIFIVDRSGSMGMNDRMEIAKDALTLFIRSLPAGSKFSIISFGSSWNALNPDIQTFDDESKLLAI